MADVTGGGYVRRKKKGGQGRIHKSKNSKDNDQEKEDKLTNK